jgi:carbamoyl-phosphate synthase large subunit
MEFWSQNQAHFLEIGTRVAISPSKTVIECSDKLKFFQTLAAHNLPVIPTALDPDGLLSETYVVKERFGSGSHNIGLNLLAENARSFSQDLNSPIFQTFIRGTEYSVDVWRSRSGNLTVCSARTRDLIIGGEAKITSTVDNPDLVAISKSIADLLDVCGIAVIQFIIDARGGIWIIECNPRIGGATTASVAAGLPLFELLIRDNLDLDCVQLAESSVRKEITQIRAEKDFIFHR